MAGNDTIAVGVLRAAAEHGLRVPEDVSVVGFDDLPIAACLNPPLTTIRHDAGIRAQLAVSALTNRIRGKEVGGSCQNVPVELVLRSSTARANEASLNGEELPPALGNGEAMPVDT